jgi:cytochrome b6-f complex subunit 5
MIDLSTQRSCTKPPKPDTLEEIILNNSRSLNVVEPLLSGIVLGLVFITLSGLFVAAYLQYKRGNQIGL